MKRDRWGFIVALEPNELIAVGTNEAGVHGAGAAKMAAKLFGLKRGVGFGISGQTFGIPTKEKHWMGPLPIPRIQAYVDRFLGIARDQPRLVFYLTPIGCGLAGLSPEQVAPMFANAPDNVILPPEFVGLHPRLRPG